MYNENVMKTIYEGLGIDIENNNDIILDEDVALIEDLNISVMNSCMLGDILQERKGVFDGLKQWAAPKPSVEDSPVYRKNLEDKDYGWLISNILQDSTNGRQKFANIRYVFMRMKKEGQKFITDEENAEETELREAVNKLKSTMQQGERVSRWDFNDVRQLFVKYVRYNKTFSTKFINTLNTFLNIGINYNYF